MGKGKLYRERAKIKCNVNECTRGQHTRGYCKPHYQGFLKDGTLPYIVHQVLHATVDERFDAYVQKTDACWLWTGSKNEKGYGQFYIQRDKKVTRYRAHRYSYERTHGKILKGMSVCHTCDNPSCVNPAHLFVGTEKDNAQDKMRKGRGNTKRKVYKREDVVVSGRMLRRGYSTIAISELTGITRFALLEMRGNMQP